MSVEGRDIENKTVLGAAAGNVAVTGIKKNDTLLSVNSIDFTLTEGTPNTKVWVVADLSSEFTVTADDTINNVGGTSSANKLLLITWVKRGQTLVGGRMAY